MSIWLARARLAQRQQITQLRAKGALEFARTIPFWLLAISGLIYASGFLVVTTYLEGYGVRDVGTDVWKSRYIYIGVLSVAFPVMIMGTIYGIGYNYLLYKDDPAPEVFRPCPKVCAFIRVFWPIFRFTVSGFVFLMVELAFYVFVMFARSTPPTSSGTSFVKVLQELLLARPILPISSGNSFGEVIQELLIMIGGVSLLILAGKLDIWLKKYWSTFLLTAVLRLAVVYWVGRLFLSIRNYYWELIVEMCRSRGPAFLLMVVLLTFIGYILYTMKWMEAKLSPTKRWEGWFLVICILGPMYFLSLMSFAHSLFAYIPATRDGGDYTVSPLVTISLKTGSVLQRARLVEETPVALYVSDELDNPLRWRMCPGVIPKLRAISRSQILVVEYVPNTVEQAQQGSSANHAIDREALCREMRPGTDLPTGSDARKTARPRGGTLE
ncbi:MAG: hypothetical protein ABSD88_16355 [Candidatus Korobacteraceae bacterium]